VTPWSSIYDESVFHEHVDSLEGKWVSLIHHLDPDLTLDAKTACDELPLHGQRVDVLAKAVTECVVDLVERADDDLGERLFDQLAF
jgi:hypothetical protein